MREIESGEDETTKKLKFASADKIERYEHLLPDFFVAVLNMDYYENALFDSDESSLSDFTPYGRGPKANRAEIGLWQTRIEEKYGMDVSDIEDGNLVKIFDRISG